MKTFFEFMTEQAAAHVGQDQVQQKRLEIQRKLETGFGAVNKDLKQMNISSMPAADRKSNTPSISNKPIVKPDKAYTSGNFNTALAAAGYDQSGKKITAIPKKTGVEKADTPISYKPKKVEATYVAHPDYSTKIQDRVFGTYRGPQDNDMKKASTSKEYTSSSYPNVRSAKAGMATDTKFKLANITKKINTPSTKPSEPVVKPKVGSLTVPQSGYPAAKKTQLAPAENQKASSGGSYKIKPGDNPTIIANDLGLTLDQLEKKNPGILKRAKRLKIGDTINR